MWKKKLFHESLVGSYWIQLNLSVSLNFVAQHIVAVNIIKDWRLCSSLDQTVAILTDNYREMFKERMLKMHRMMIWVNIFQLFSIFW